MNKKILAILGILIVAVSISTVSAGLFGDDGASDLKNVTIDGIDFNLPDGFSEDVSSESVNETSSVGGFEYKYNQKLFENDKQDYVSILVGDYGEYKVTDEIVSTVADEKQTINGIDGYTADKDGIHIFAYPKNDKLVVLTATEKDLFDDFLIAE